MPFERGRLKSGGRKAGSLNQLTVRLRQASLAAGETPLEYMLRLMRDSSQPAEVRGDMAKAAAPYIHPRKQAVDESRSGGITVIVNRSGHALDGQPALEDHSREEG